ncbi:MarR family winged helix-turn-helix transcriptional regulator [Limimaricola cinnabarinus]|jgi:DNA-binding MarR family transcriptional regulator|uniref:MarR family transcriptional regulator n=1 Tax=Limimaricola cinnabarinus TaxID=1125964 RepID=A0A2G1MH57_9RHOB|nr:MarR family transcriptional regulator [Limimaricola cinnabarinus]PHP27980.1 MarR family transcriptional regulator [Limimaricola cinnabarinus]
MSVELHAKAGKTRLRLWLKLLKTSNAVETALRDRLRTEFGTTLPRFDVMAALARSPEGLKMTELSRRLRVSNGNVTGIVDRLEAEGHAERHAVAGDRRAMEVRLTGRGRAHFGTLATAHEEWVNELMGAIPEAEAARIMDGLDHVARDLEEKQ